MFSCVLSRHNLVVENHFESFLVNSYFACTELWFKPRIELHKPTLDPPIKRGLQQNYAHTWSENYNNIRDSFMEEMALLLKGLMNNYKRR